MFIFIFLGKNCTSNDHFLPLIPFQVPVLGHLNVKGKLEPLLPFLCTGWLIRDPGPMVDMVSFGP